MLEVPPNGINVHDDFTMKCHFGEFSEKDKVYTNWYHSNRTPENILYSHVPDQSGDKRNEWQQRDVTGLYHNTYHEVSVKQAVQEDQKLYVCEFFVIPDGDKSAEAWLHVHGMVAIKCYYNSCHIEID